MMLRVLLAIALTAANFSLGQAAITVGKFYYEDTASVVCQPNTSNSCRAEFPRIPDKVYTIESMSCNLYSSNGRSIIQATIGVTNAPGGSTDRVRYLPTYSNQSLGDDRANFAVGNPEMKIGRSRIVVVRMTLCCNFPYSGGGSCTMTGRLSID